MVRTAETITSSVEALAALEPAFAAVALYAASIA